MLSNLILSTAPPLHMGPAGAPTSTGLSKQEDERAFCRPNTKTLK